MAGDHGGVAHLFDEHVLDQILPHVEMRAIAGDVGEPARKVGGEDAMLQRIDPRAFALEVVAVEFLQVGAGHPAGLADVEKGLFELLGSARHR